MLELHRKHWKETNDRLTLHAGHVENLYQFVPFSEPNKFAIPCEKNVYSMSCCSRHLRLAKHDSAIGLSSQDRYSIRRGAPVGVARLNGGRLQYRLSRQYGTLKTFHWLKTRLSLMNHLHWRLNSTMWAYHTTPRSTKMFTIIIRLNRELWSCPL